MNTATSGVVTEGTASAPRFYEGPVDVIDDISVRQRYYTYRTDAGWVACKTLNVMFTIDQPVTEVWRYFKDFNLWQNSYHHYYSGVIGDLQGKTVRLTLGKPGDENRRSGDYQVVTVIPEHLIIKSQPLQAESRISGTMVFMLDERHGKTIISALMQHDRIAQAGSEEEALEFWRKLAPDSQMKWRDIFIPNLKRLARK